MRQATPKLIALLDADQFIMADLYTISTIQGQVYHYTNADNQVVYDGKTYLSDALMIERDSIEMSLGIQVDNLSVTISTNIGENGQEVMGIPVTKAFQDGHMDGARFKLERYFFDHQDMTGEALKLFEGLIVEPEIDRNSIRFEVVSDIDELNVMMPRNLYQPSCRNTLFDSICSVLRADYSQQGIVQMGSTIVNIVCTLSQAQGYFTQGVIEFTSGENKGLKRTVRQHLSGFLALTLPLPRAPNVNDAFTVYAGCDKRLETCVNRFNNKACFRAEPYIPIPETSI